MHDIEHHTVCYLRDLLLTPAHRDPDVTSFLACWVFEELWHGEAIGAVLRAHGEPAGAARVGRLRQRRKWRDASGRPRTWGRRPWPGESFIALHMAWGAVNEWTTQAGYARLATLEGHPVLSDLLQPHHAPGGPTHRLLRLRGRPAGSPPARGPNGWPGPPCDGCGSRSAPGVMPGAEVRFLAGHLFGGTDGAVTAARSTGGSTPSRGWPACTC